MHLKKSTKIIKHTLFRYLAKFFAIFCITYYGTIAVEGLAAPGNYYWPFVDQYLNYPAWLRATLLWGSNIFCGLLEHETFIPDAYHLYMVGGRGVQLVYSCLGFGVMSFWLAFVVANKGGFWKKSFWVLGGMLAIWLINVLRISLTLLSNNKKASIPFDMDNHTFFNVLAYGAIFGLMFLYDRSFGREVKY